MMSIHSGSHRIICILHFKNIHDIISCFELVLLIQIDVMSTANLQESLPAAEHSPKTGS